MYASDATSVSVTKQQMDAAEGVSRMINVPGRGEMQYYAQNDPVWKNLVYEAKGAQKRRKFGDGGCVPTSMAIVLANLIPEEKYWYLSYYSGLDTGLTFCNESVNQYYCNHLHAQYRLEQPWEYRRYLPVAIASFATGNNTWKSVYRMKSGTNSSFYGRIGQIYGMNITIATRGPDKDLILDKLASGAIAVVTVGSGNIYTGGGHYMVAVAADEEYLYIMDPYYKEDYSKTDRHHLIEIVEPGLIRIHLSDWDRSDLSKFYIFEKLD